MTYGEIQAQFVALMNRTDLRANTALQTLFLQQGIVRVARSLRVPAMEKGLIVTVGATWEALSIPSDFLQLINIEFPTSTEVWTLKRDMLMRVKTQGLQSGTPRSFARQGGRWYVAPAPTEGDTFRIDYYSDEKFTELTESDDTNLITEIAWDAILYAALCAAGDYWSDKRLVNWEARLKQIMDNLDAQGDGDELTADAAVGVAYSFPSED